MKPANFKAGTLLLALVYLSFISLGLPDAMMGVAWSAMRVQMNQPLAAVGVLTITMMLCAVISAWLTGRIVAKVGTGVVVAASCMLTGLALWGMPVVVLLLVSLLAITSALNRLT